MFTRFINPPGSLFRTVLKQKSSAPNSEDTELLIAPQPGDIVINKASYGLKSKDLKRLHRHGIKRITGCGLDTDACVLGTMFSLCDGKIECHLKESMCWSSSGLPKPALAIIRAQFPETR